MSNMAFNAIYTPQSMCSSFYPSMLRLLYSINANLKKDGILAPGMNSIKNTQILYNLIGQPLNSIPTIHVGGTNGKGTTSWKLSETLRNSGYKTGLFVSPHLASFRERIQVDSQLIPEDCFTAHLNTLLQLCAQHAIPATEFELTFLLASMHFRHTQCQAVVLEVGCGGLFDATNVVSSVASVICSVSLDHTRILGDSLDAIARNKAGIFKPGQPALVGPDVPLERVQEVAVSSGATLHTFSDAWKRYSHKARAPCVDNDAIVDTDALNADIALLALCLLKEHRPEFSQLDLRSEAVTAGLASRPPCRWEVLSCTVHAGGADVSVTAVLDMGHNPAAVGALCRKIRRDFADKHVRVVYAMSRDKDVRECLRTVLSAVPRDHIHFVQSGNFRAATSVELSTIFREETGEEMAAIGGNSLTEVLQEVFRLAALDSVSDRSRSSEGDAKTGSVVVICGTGYIMPDAREFLGIVEPRDSVDLLRMKPE